MAHTKEQSHKQTPTCVHHTRNHIGANPHTLRRGGSPSSNINIHSPNRPTRSHIHKVEEIHKPKILGKPSLGGAMKSGSATATSAPL